MDLKYLREIRHLIVEQNRLGNYNVVAELMNIRKWLKIYGYIKFSRQEILNMGLTQFVFENLDKLS